MARMGQEATVTAVEPDCPDVMLRSTPDEVDHQALSRPKKKEVEGPANYKRRQLKRALRPMNCCGCRSSCIDMLGVVADEHRRLFVEKRDFMAQTAYLASMITIRKAPTDSVPGSYQYALPGSNGIPIVICRQAFMNVLGMGTVKLTTVIKRMANQYGVPQGAVPSFGMDGHGKSNVVVRNRTLHNVLEIARAFTVSQLVGPAGAIPLGPQVEEVTVGMSGIDAKVEDAQLVIEPGLLRDKVDQDIGRATVEIARSRARSYFLLACRHDRAHISPGLPSCGSPPRAAAPRILYLLAELA
ncbi:unnamed protein product (mitochondrion) [Plasmodiophora brassicae]|uniref:Uncharacterized protein n=1 Tax=Plasmodiophora brassicae TaxID=37360 RepID=A0A3P3XZN7_PLABS|nr:unnamed protein product [Plasmodiophora brassicae]